MNESWAKFLISKVLHQGTVYRIEKISDHLDDRIPVDAKQVNFWAAKVTKFRHLGTSGRPDDVDVLVEITANDAQGEIYGAHMNLNFLRTQEEYLNTIMFDGPDLDLLEPFMNNSAKPKQ